MASVRSKLTLWINRCVGKFQGESVGNFRPSAVFRVADCIFVAPRQKVGEQNEYGLDLTDAVQSEPDIECAIRYPDLAARACQQAERAQFRDVAMQTLDQILDRASEASVSSKSRAWRLRGLYSPGDRGRASWPTYGRLYHIATRKGTNVTTASASKREFVLSLIRYTRVHCCASIASRTCAKC